LGELDSELIGFSEVNQGSLGDVEVGCNVIQRGLGFIRLVELFLSVSIIRSR